MSNDSALIDYETESKSAQSLSDDTQNTDFTQVVCCAFGDQPAEQDDRQAKAELINESIEMETKQPFSIKHFFSRLLGLS
jgi:hypothetical protein